MADSPVEWDANGKPISAAPTSATEWDADGKPISAASSPAPAQPSGSIRSGDSRSLFGRLTTPTPDNPQDGTLKRGVNFLSNVGASGLKTLWQIAGSPTRVAPGSHAAPGFDPADPYAHPALPTPTGISDAVSHLATHKMDATAALTGQAAAMGVADPANLADAMESAGSSLKTAGGKVSDITGLHSDALDRVYGAKPGQGLSENRIVGATPAALKTKLDAAIPPLGAKRSAILSRSTAGPQNIRAAVDQPFADLTSKVTHPKTGVADPSEISAITRARAAAGFQQDPLTGKPAMADGVPVERDLEYMTPAEIAEYNTNLRSMAGYAGKTSPLAEQAIKGAGSNLRAKLSEVAPESTDLTRQLHNSEAAQDVLQRQLRGGHNSLPYSEYSLARGIVNTTVAPAVRFVGTATGAGMDAAGSGLKSLAGKIRPEPPPGPPPAGATGMAVSPQSPAPNPSTPQAPPAELGSPLNPAALPANAGPTRATPAAAPPPNVSLKERVSGFKAGRQTTAAPLGSNVGIPGARTQGPEGPGQFEISPRRLTAGPKKLTQKVKGKMKGKK